jgi:hypothetical protein
MINTAYALRHPAFLTAQAYDHCNEALAAERFARSVELKLVKAKGDDHVQELQDTVKEARADAVCKMIRLKESFEPQLIRRTLHSPGEGGGGYAVGSLKPYHCVQAYVKMNDMELEAMQRILVPEELGELDNIQARKATRTVMGKVSCRGEEGAAESDASPRISTSSPEWRV